MSHYDIVSNTIYPGCGIWASLMVFLSFYNHYIPRRKSGIYWIQVRRAAAAAAAAVEISLWTR